ncbi:MAG: BON domain-containing protein [Betaproteobacteria bacterium]|nr:BON domain-containing protein [Betaproteobacteria bacterium]MDH3437537.1 BON domain-containing protein [Betaproteobacteria bacterium]
MNLSERNAIRRAFLTALACALALGLAACEPRPAAEKMGRPANTAEKVEPTGKVAVENLATVRPPVDDVTLAVNVKAALIAAPGLNAMTIDVNASAGAVTLLGTTNTSTRRDLAGYVALRVEGVNRMRNQIVIVTRHPLPVTYQRSLPAPRAARASGAQPRR